MWQAVYQIQINKYPILNSLSLFDTQQNFHETCLIGLNTDLKGLAWNKLAYNSFQVLNIICGI